MFGRTAQRRSGRAVGLAAAAMVMVLADACAVMAQARGPGRGEDHVEGRRGRGGRFGFGAALFKLTPEDQRPLQEGEKEQLVEFAREHMPQFHRLLKRLRQRHPQRFAARLDEIVPRLRQLKRLFEYDPRVGRVFRNHTQTQFGIRRTMRVLRRTPTGSALHEQGRQALRELVAESVRSEVQVLRLLLAEREAHEEEHIQARGDYLLSNDADLAAASETARAVIKAYRDAPDSSARATAEEQVRALARRQVKREIRALQQRVEALAGNATDEVDRRVERLERAVQQRGPGHHGRRHWHERPED